jgi:hypothetical protein
VREYGATGLSMEVYETLQMLLQEVALMPGMATLSLSPSSSNPDASFQDHPGSFSKILEEPIALLQPWKMAGISDHEQSRMREAVREADRFQRCRDDVAVADEHSGRDMDLRKLFRRKFGGVLVVEVTFHPIRGRGKKMPRLPSGLSASKV